MKSIKCDIVRFWRVWLLSHFHVKTPRHDKNCKAVNFKSTIYVHFWLYFFPSFILVILMLITFWVSAMLIKNRKSIFPHKLKQIKKFYCLKISFLHEVKTLMHFTDRHQVHFWRLTNKPATSLHIGSSPSMLFVWTKLQWLFLRWEILRLMLMRIN